MLAILSIILLIFLTACGTLLYPDRVGQERGRIDPAVAVMDGLCVLLVVVPGLIAFVVDFATGAIYLPEGHLAEKDAQAVSLERIACIGPQSGEDLDWQQVSKALESHTGKAIDLNKANMDAQLFEGESAMKTAKIRLRNFELKQ